MPVTGDDGVPLTYVSRADAEAFCAENGVRLPTEIEWEAAARGGDDRLWPWGDELPDTTRATFGQGIGGPSPVGLHPAGAAPCGALDLAGNVFEWTADGAARGGSYLSGPDELRCSARYPVHPAARDPYIGFRVVAVEPRGDLRLGRGARRRLRDRPRPGRDPAAARRRGRVRARADASHERAVRALRRRGQERPRLPTGRPRPTIPSPSSTGTRRPPSAPGPAAGCRPRPSGRRRPAAPTGAPTRGATRRTRAAPRSAPGSSTAPRRRSARTRTARAPTACWTWPGTSGSGRRPSTHRANACSAAARSRARVSPGPAARCAATAGRAGARHTSAFASRERA